MKNSYNLIVTRIGVFVCLCSLGGVLAAESKVLKNPYADIDWNRVKPYIANLHSHTIYSDGRAEPDELIYAYMNAGYSILAIADHDNGYTHREGERDPGKTHETTWPWTRWIKEKPAKTWDVDGMETAAYYPTLGAHGMLAVRANELSSHPHIVSLFNDCGFSQRVKKTTLEHDLERIRKVQGRSGIAICAHPSAYVPPHRWQATFGKSLDAAVEHYGTLLTQYKCLMGVEFNQSDITRRMPEPVIIFDKLLQRHYRQQNIFVYGNDDNHSKTVSDDAVFTIVYADELTAPAVRHALEKGHTLVGQRTEKMPTLKGVSVDDVKKNIILKIENYDKVIWMRDGAHHSEGEVLDYSSIKDSIVRFQIVAGNVNFYSQAFFIQ